MNYVHVPRSVRVRTSSATCVRCRERPDETARFLCSCPGLDAPGERRRWRGHGGPYDCVIPLSGGKDSTCILHSAVQDLGLTPIATNYAFVREGRMTKEEALDCPRSSPLLGAFRNSRLCE